MKMLVDWLAAICAFGASWFWYKSASAFLPDPPVGAFSEQVMPALAEYREAMRRATHSNRLAALLSGVSALLAGLGLVIPS
jgi:hypothetical protein